LWTTITFFGQLCHRGFVFHIHINYGKLKIKGYYLQFNVMNIYWLKCLILHVNSFISINFNLFYNYFIIFDFLSLLFKFLGDHEVCLSSINQELRVWLIGQPYSDLLLWPHQFKKKTTEKESSILKSHSWLFRLLMWLTLSPSPSQLDKEITSISRVVSLETRNFSLSLNQHKDARHLELGILHF